MNEYIDVRGLSPIYFIGSLFVRLPHYARDWDIERARIYLIHGL